MNTSILNTIKEYLKTQPVQKAGVFGSFSRGEERADSDIDLLVQYDRTNHKVGLFTIIGIQQHLQQIVGRNVDLVEEGTVPGRHYSLVEAVSNRVRSARISATKKKCDWRPLPITQHPQHVIVFQISK